LRDPRGVWRDPLDRFLWIWFLTVLVVFSFSGTKLPHYLLYGCTPLFVLMARRRERLTNRWLAFLPPILLFAVLALLPLVLAVVVQLADGGLLALRAHELALVQDGRRALDPGYWIAVVAGLAALVALLRWSRLPLWSGLVLAGVIQTLVVFGVLVPRLFEVMQGPVKEAGLIAKRLDRPTVVYRTSMPSFSVYRDAITPNRPPHAGDLVFLRIDKLDALAHDYPDLRSQVVYRGGPVALLSMDARE